MDPELARHVPLPGHSEMVSDVPFYKPPTVDITPILASQRQGQISPFESLLLVPDPDLLLWSYGWKSFLNVLYWNRNGKGLKILDTLVGSTIIDVNDESTLQVYCNRFDKITTLMCVFQYFNIYSDCLGVPCFVPGLRSYGIAFMTRDDGA